MPQGAPAPRCWPGVCRWQGRPGGEDEGSHGRTAGRCDEGTAAAVHRGNGQQRGACCARWPSCSSAFALDVLGLASSISFDQ